jgi:hypothetical protein
MNPSTRESTALITFHAFPMNVAIADPRASPKESRMQIRFVSVLATVAGILFSIQLVGCRCCKDADEPGASSCGVTPRVGARGYFGEVTTKPVKLAPIRLTGSFDYDGPTDDQVTLAAVKVYGSPGLKSSAELRTDANLLTTLSPAPAAWRTDWLRAAWGGENIYSILVHYDVKIVPHEGSTHSCATEHWGYFEVSTKSPFIELKDIASTHTGGSTNATVSCNGSFNGATNVALYDVLVLNPTVHVVDSIVISAGPTGSALTELLTLAPPNIPVFPWHPRPIQGVYDGTTDDYTLQIKVHYADPSEETFTGQFHSIRNNQSTPILLN